MPGTDKVKFPAGEIYDSIKDGYKHTRRSDFDQVAVHLAERFGWRIVTAGFSPHQGISQGHKQSSRYALI